MVPIMRLVPATVFSCRVACASAGGTRRIARPARFSSPLGVYDFQKRSSIIFCSAEGASELGKTASVLARGESLTAHARSAEYRIK